MPAQPAQPSDLVDVAAPRDGVLHRRCPTRTTSTQQVAFGTSGHRGSSLRTAFNETHILATTQAICEYRRAQGFDGPLFIGRDTHGLSEPAWATALEVLVANDVTVLVDSADRYTPTPGGLARHPRAPTGARHRRRRDAGRTVSPTASWSPRRTTRPADGGFKYNPPHGGPADSDATKVIAARANELIRGRPGGRHAGSRSRGPGPRQPATTSSAPTSTTCPHVLDIEAIRGSGLRIGADPLGGASVDYWGAIAERHGLDLTVVNPLVDATWRFMTLDWDGKIRMDCSSPSAMASPDRRSATSTTSPPATTPTPTGTASSPRMPG